MSLYPDFQVLLLGQEKGFVSVEVQNQGNELALIFGNEGTEPITVTKESLMYIQSVDKDKKWVGFNLIPVVKHSHDELNAIEIDLPFNSLLGKIIHPGESIKLPFFQWKKYQHKKGFKNASSVMINKFTIEEKNSSMSIISLQKMRIVVWNEENYYRRYRSTSRGFEINILPDDKIEIVK